MPDFRKMTGTTQDIVPRNRLAGAVPSTNGHHKNGAPAHAEEPPAPTADVDDDSHLDEVCNVVLCQLRNAAQSLAREEERVDRGGLRTDDAPPTPALTGWLSGGKPRFPVHVLPALLQEYIAATAHSIHCSPDLVAVPMLAVAGAATGRSGRKLRFKQGWELRSCLWTACMTPSSGGKTPAMNAAQNFYDDRQEAEHVAWEQAKEEYDEADDKTGLDKPGPYPALKLTDTTIESLRGDLANGAVLFTRDELGAWCHQMGQYKAGNADKPDWLSFWSHSVVNIGRKTERVYVKEPFVAVTGMMVPGSARQLNYRGDADDGFVHRMLLACPDSLPPVATLDGVPDDLTAEYKRRMTRLFDSPGENSQTLTFEPAASRMLLRWANRELFSELYELTCTNPDERRPALRQYEPTQTAPPWLESKYRKLYENCLRLCLVLHEVWRVAGGDPVDDDGPDPRDFYGEHIKFQDGVVDRITVERAIAVVEYFKAHIGPVQDLMGGEPTDQVDVLAAKFIGKGTVTVREVSRGTTLKAKDRVLGLFTEWQRRGYGQTVPGGRTDQTTFKFGGGGEVAPSGTGTKPETRCQSAPAGEAPQVAPSGTGTSDQTQCHLPAGPSPEKGSGK